MSEHELAESANCQARRASNFRYALMEAFAAIVTMDHDSPGVRCECRMCLVKDDIACHFLSEEVIREDIWRWIASRGLRLEVPR